MSSNKTCSFWVGVGSENICDPTHTLAGYVWLKANNLSSADIKVQLLAAERYESFRPSHHHVVALFLSSAADRDDDFNAHPFFYFQRARWWANILRTRRSPNAKAQRRARASAPRRISHLTEIRSPPAHSNSGNGDKLILEDLHHLKCLCETQKSNYKFEHLVFVLKRFINLNVQVVMIRIGDNLSGKFLSKLTPRGKFYPVHVLLLIYLESGLS